MSLAQQGSHRSPLIDEEAHVALRFGQGQGTIESGQGFCALALYLERQRTKDEDFNDTAYPGLGLGVLEEPSQQNQRLRKKWTRRVFSPLSDAHPHQGQVFRLAGISHLLVGSREAALLHPAHRYRQLAVCEPKPRPHCCSTCPQARHEVTLIGQFCERGESRQCSLEVPTCLLETGKRCISECDDFSIDRQGPPGQVHSLHELTLSFV